MTIYRIIVDSALLLIKNITITGIYLIIHTVDLIIQRNHDNTN